MKRIYEDRKEFVKEIENCISQFARIYNRLGEISYKEIEPRMDHSFEEYVNERIAKEVDNCMDIITGLSGFIGMYHDEAVLMKYLRPEPKEKSHEN